MTPEFDEIKRQRDRQLVRDIIMVLVSAATLVVTVKVLIWIL